MIRRALAVLTILVASPATVAAASPESLAVASYNVQFVTPDLPLLRGSCASSPATSRTSPRAPGRSAERSPAST